MKAYFAGGCFWCVTPIYRIWGVDRITCGYSGGLEENPCYRVVKAQKTGHRETLELEYQPEKVSYDKLLEIFLANVDPWDAKGQFIDRGHSYTLAVYYQTEEEKAAALARIHDLEEKAGRQARIALEPFRSFWKAEEEHQDFDLKNPEALEKEMIESGRKKEG